MALVGPILYWLHFRRISKFMDYDHLKTTIMVGIIFCNHQETDKCIWTMIIMDNHG